MTGRVFARAWMVLAPLCGSVAGKRSAVSRSTPGGRVLWDLLALLDNHGAGA